MRIRSYWLLVVLIAACVHESNPDPRNLGADQVARRGLGAWIVVQTYSTTSCSDCKGTVEGELIAVDDAAVYVHRHDGPLHRVGWDQVDTATAYLYSIGESLETWRVLGGLSTLSHGAWFLLSFPIWLALSAFLVNEQVDKAILKYPEHTWEELAKWARFPQGLPPGMSAQTLEHQTRMPPQQQSPRIPADASIDAPADASASASPASDASI